MRTASRIFIASIAGSIWVSMFDGGTGLLLGDTALLSPGVLLVVLGCALLLGAIAGAVPALIIAAAQVRGPATDVTSAEVTRLLAAPWWVLALGAFALVIPVLIAVPLRAMILWNRFYAAALDLGTLVVGWILAGLVVHYLGMREGRRISRFAGGITLTLIGVAASLLIAPYRPGLESSDLWGLVLIGSYALTGFGIALLLPDTPRLVRVAWVTGAVALAGCGAALYSLQVSAATREEVASDWRVVSWIITGATSAVDRDRDGFSPLFGGGDCDDGRDDVNPEGIEIAGNGVDENCRDGDRAPTPPWPPRPTFVHRPKGLGKPKSIVMISIDALRRDHVGAYGYKRPVTPRIDAFSQKAVRFTNAYSSAPTTRIALPVLFTGRSLGEIPWDRKGYPYGMLDRVDTLADILNKRRSFKSAAFITHPYMSRRWGWVQGFDEVDDSLVLPLSQFSAVSTGEALAAKVSHWIEDHKEKKFFVWAHFLDPHGQYLKHAEGPDFGDEPVDLYDSEIWYTDRAVGTILDTLDALGISDQTSVVIFSDHGELFKEHGRQTHGGALWEHVAQIPLLIQSPGLLPGTCDCLAGLVDIAPTVLNLLDINGGKYGMSGSTLLPSATGAPCQSHQEIVLEMRYGRLSAPNLTALVGTRWKLLMNNTAQTYALFDLKNDPDELHDLGETEPQQLKAMKNRLQAWNEVYANREIRDIIDHSTMNIPPASAEKVDAVFENGIELVAMDFGDRKASVDDGADLQLYFRTPKRVREVCHILFYLVDDADRDRYKTAHPPLNGTFPVARWPIGRIVNDGYGLEILSKNMKHGPLTPDKYEVRLGMQCDTNDIPAVQGNTDSDGRVHLGELHIKAGKNKMERENHDDI